MKPLAAAILLLAAACASGERPPPSVGSACRAIEFEGDRFTDCRADPKHDRVRLVIDPKARTLADLAGTIVPGVKRVRFAMNAGMYDEAGKPIGLAIVDGRQVHALNRKRGGGNFHLLPNGVFSAGSDGWHIRSSDAYAALAGLEPQVATQSGPMLVIAGKLHPAFSPDGDSRYIRNGVGIDAAGGAHFVISEQPVSFGRFARLFRDQLDCPNALFLDGAVSALWDPASDRIDSSVPLGPILVIERPD